MFSVDEPNVSGQLTQMTCRHAPPPAEQLGSGAFHTPLGIVVIHTSFIFFAVFMGVE